MNKYINIFYFSCIIFFTLSGCDQGNKTMQMESKEEKIKIVEDTLEGDSSSKERWEHIQKNLSNIKAGMKRQDVIDFIGYPDWIEFTPENVMQYSVTYFDAEKEEPSASIHIILNDNKRVVEIRSDNTFYGPLPDCEK